VTSFLLAQNTQILHARIAESVTPYSRMMQSGSAYLFWNASRAKGLIGLNDEITRQAQIIAYANDFKLMLLVSLPVALLIFLMRRPGRRPVMEAAPVE
jgi:DHA2 family multidrug resistance protein